MIKERTEVLKDMVQKLSTLEVESRKEYTKCTNSNSVCMCVWRKNKVNSVITASLRRVDCMTLTPPDLAYTWPSATVNNEESINDWGQKSHVNKCIFYITMKYSLHFLCLRANSHYIVEQTDFSCMRFGWECVDQHSFLGGWRQKGADRPWMCLLTSSFKSFPVFFFLISYPSGVIV